MLIAAQNNPGEMATSGSDAELAFTDAFRAANPDVINFGNNDYKGQEEYSGVVFPAAYKYLAQYQGDMYGPINTSLWWANRDPVTGAMTSTHGLDASARSIQALLLKTTTPIDMTVSRSVKSSHPLAAWAATADVGMPYVNKGFDSSSLNAAIDRGGPDSTVIRMRVPAGSHGMYLGATFPDSFSYEQEWLLPANSSWVVSGKTTLPDGRTEVTVDLVAQQNFAGKQVWPKPTKAKKVAKPKVAPVV
jgi:hypothetical protein